MISRIPMLALLSGAWLSVSPLGGQTSDEEFRVYNDHPRLFLTAQRLRLLKRERERDSVRWRQFEALATGAAQMPEPGFAGALYFAITGDAAQGRSAIDWAVGPGLELRQLALVYDWCQPLLRPEQALALSQKIGRLLAQAPASAPGVAAERDRVLAIIATADENRHGEEKALRQAVDKTPDSLPARVVLGGREGSAGSSQAT